VAPPVGHPAAGSATLGIGLGLGVGWRLGEPHNVSHRPHLLFIDIVWRGPPTSVGFDAPRSGRWPKVQVGRWAKLGREQPNILLFDLNISLNFKLNFTLLSFTIPSQISA
jgi:hypothetical protein